MNQVPQRDINKRIIKCAKYYVRHKSTIREVAKHFNISKSQLHTDFTIHLPQLNDKLYKKVQKISNINKLEAHLRGGNVIKLKYQLLKNS